MRAGPRFSSPRLSLLARIGSLACFLIALVARGQAGLSFPVVALGLLLVVLARREKAASAPGAIHSQSADFLQPDGKKLPGQLSITPTHLIWVPSGYASKRGATEVRASFDNRPVLTMTRGAALFDLIIDVRAEADMSFRILTHRSRRLQDALARVDD